MYVNVAFPEFFFFFFLSPPSYNSVILHSYSKIFFFQSTNLEEKEKRKKKKKCSESFQPKYTFSCGPGIWTLMLCIKWSSRQVPVKIFSCLIIISSSQSNRQRLHWNTPVTLKSQGQTVNTISIFFSVSILKTPEPHCYPWERKTTGIIQNCWWTGRPRRPQLGARDTQAAK